MWINFESTIKENSKSVKSVKINPEKKEEIIIIKTVKKNLHSKKFFRAY